MESMQGVRAVLTRDVGRVDLGVIAIGPAKSGSIITAPPGIVEALIRRGIASLTEEDRVNSRDIIERIWLENREANNLREDFPKDFYVRARLSMIGDSQGGNKALAQQLRELAQIRLRKILMFLAVNPSIAESTEFLNKLTPEERTLVKTIAPIIRDYLNTLVGL